MAINMEISHIFRALGDDTRIGIIALLANGERRRVSDIAAQFQMTRPGVAKHLAILENAGVIGTEWNGREKLCFLKKDALAHAHGWLNRHDRLWRTAS